MQTPAKRRTKLQDRQVRPNSKRAQSAQPPTPSPVSVPDFAAWIAIYVATFVAYWPALRGGMVWDDKTHITAPALQSLHGLWRIWFELGAVAQYYPLLHSAFWIEHRLWGDAVLGYHLANVTEHALAACLVVLIVRRLALPGAWLAGLIFALHPVCVESVAWISEQKSTLSGLFYLAAAFTYLHFDRSRRRSQYFYALGFFLLALLSKSVTATLPAALLVVLWWQRGRIEWRRDVMPLLPWLVVGATSGLFTAWVERTYIGASGKDYDLTLVQHILLAGRIPFFYASKILWPTNLMFTYPRWQIDPAVWWQYLYPLGLLALLAAFSVLAWRSSRSAERAPLAALLYFVGTLFPVLGFLHVYPFRFSYVADHFQYLASLGILLPVACILTLTIPRILPWKAAIIAVEVVLLAVLGVLTWRQSGMYKDSETLYRVTLARNPESFMAHCNLGWLLAQRPGHLPEAIAEYQAALRIEPRFAISHNDLGIAFTQTPGRQQDAIAEFQVALRIEPNDSKVHNNLAAALVQAGRLPEAIAEFQAALRIEPNDSKVHSNLAAALVQAGRLPEAIAEYQSALRIQPNSAQIHNNMGGALVQAGRLLDAIEQYQAALAIQPSDPDTHKNLAEALAKLPDRRQDAITHYQAVLQLRPDSEDARQAIARLQALEVQTRHQPSR